MRWVRLLVLMSVLSKMGVVGVWVWSGAGLVPEAEASSGEGKKEKPAPKEKETPEQKAEHKEKAKEAKEEHKAKAEEEPLSLRRFEEFTSFLRTRLLRPAVFDELQGHHESHPPDIPNPWVLDREAVEACAELGAPLR